MTRSTKSISLVLVSSSLILAGCYSRAPDGPADTARHSAGHSSGHYRGTRTSSGVSSGSHSSPTGGKSSTGGQSVSTRGGFGGAGHASGGS